MKVKPKVKIDAPAAELLKIYAPKNALEVIGALASVEWSPNYSDIGRALDIPVSTVHDVVKKLSAYCEVEILVNVRVRKTGGDE